MIYKNKFTFDLKIGKSLLWEKINPEDKVIEFAEMFLSFPIEHFKQTSIIMSSDKFKNSIAIPDIVFKVLFPQNALSIHKTLQTLLIEFRVPLEDVKNHVHQESRDIKFCFAEGSRVITYNNYITQYEKNIYCKGFNNINVFYIPLLFMIGKTRHYDLLYQRKQQKLIVGEPFYADSNYEFTSKDFPVRIPANSRKV